MCIITLDLYGSSRVRQQTMYSNVETFHTPRARRKDDEHGKPSVLAAVPWCKMQKHANVCNRKEGGDRGRNESCTEAEQ